MIETVLKKQYELIKDSRRVLISYCSTFAPGDLNKGLEAFAEKNICYLFIHTANTYRFWLQKFAMNEQVPSFKPDEISNIEQVKTVYQEVDEQVEKFVNQFQSQFMDSITRPIPGRAKEYTTTPFALLTHVITHEFHHKGQILSMSRNLGYTPVDTDILRF